MKDVEAWIKNYEGLRLNSYLDINGHVSIGWGRNLERGINIDEAELMFQNDLRQTIEELENQDWYVIQPEGVKKALINMNFNLGLKKLFGFRDMIKALLEKNYNKAANAALDSLWAKQVGNRAKDIAVMILAGK